MPPKWAVRFLQLICPDRLFEEIEGDLIQKFGKDIESVGVRKARRKFIWHTIRYLRPGILFRNTFPLRINSSPMIKNYFTVAIRNMTRQKTYSFINILGLSVGLTASLFIAIYIIDELSYDRFSQDADNIFRVAAIQNFQGQEVRYATSSIPLVEAIKTEIPEVSSACRVQLVKDMEVRYEDKAFVQPKFLEVDSNFFDFFGYKLIEGDPKTCLSGPNKIVISEAAAKIYFDYKGPENNSPVGKFLGLGRAVLVQVTGIAKNMPHNSHLKFDMALSIESTPRLLHDTHWQYYSLYNYFKLKKIDDLPTVKGRLDYFIEKYMGPEIERDFSVSLKRFRQRGDDVRFVVQPLTSIHLHSQFDGELEANGDIRYIYIFGAVGVLLILVACINFMNLSTARATSRAKEVGVRKSVGALRSKLVQQFMVESFLYTFLSTALSIVLVISLTQPFIILTGKEIGLNSFMHPLVLSGIVLFIIVVALIAGSYPAFYLSSFMPVSVLKGKVIAGTQRSGFRNGLVIFQFMISTGLIIGTLIINEQLQFLQEQNLGFHKENVIVIHRAKMLGHSTEAFKNELLKHPEFVTVSFASELPPYVVVGDDLFRPEGTDQLLDCNITEVDADNLKTMGYTMKSGRFFSLAFRSDSAAVVINATCAKLMGYSNPEGRTIIQGTKKWNVIGVINDFNYRNLHGEIKPLVMLLGRWRTVMAVRLTPGKVASKIKVIESIWKTLAVGSPFQYSFIDEDFNASFRSEQKLGNLFLIFTAITIFIASLGLFGLITYMSEHRVKEIGIRKVMGATVTQITILLSGNLIRLVIISFVVAVPITWYGMNQWLQSFAYRVNFDFLAVIISGMIGVFIAMVTVGYRSFRAATGNPVDSLRNE